MFKQIFALFYEEGFKVPKTHLTEHEILLLLPTARVSENFYSEVYCDTYHKVYENKKSANGFLERDDGLEYKED